MGGFVTRFWGFGVKCYVFWVLVSSTSMKVVKKRFEEWGDVFFSRVRGRKGL